MIIIANNYLPAEVKGGRCSVIFIIFCINKTSFLIPFQIEENVIVSNHFICKPFNTILENLCL